MAAPDDKTATPPRVKECSTCLFWDNSVQRKQDTLPVGLCRVNAPKALEQFGTIEIDPRTQIHFSPAVWPVTLAGENCGEHKFAPKVAAS